MNRYEKLSPRVYGVNLYYGKISPKVGHTSEMFYIVNYTDDVDFIKNEALQMIPLSGRLLIHFYGRKSSIWKKFFIEKEQLIFGNGKKRVAIIEYNAFNDLFEVLEERVHFRPNVPCDIYLIYDDKGMYEEMKHRLNL